MKPDSPTPPSPNGAAKRVNNKIAVHIRHDEICNKFEADWNDGKQPRIEDFLAGEPEATREPLFRELLTVERDFRRDRGENPTADEYRGRLQAFEACIAELFEQTSALPLTPEPPPSDMRYDTGKVINERFLILAQLGRGGMGIVYEALDQKLGKKVALKFVTSNTADNPEWVRQLQGEVATAQKVTHKHVCRVHDYHEAMGHYFLAMEYASDGSLHDLLKRENGPLPPDKVNTIAWQLCEGLSAIHEQEILHRDLKPGNVLLDKDEGVKVADFGLAKSADQQFVEGLQGTWQYMAPEQLDNQKPTKQSDLFALGLILYELVTGVRPYLGRTPQEMRQRQDKPPVPPSELVEIPDKALEEAILLCLELDPAKRPGSAQQVKEKLPPLTPEQTEKVMPAIPLQRKWAIRMLAVSLFGLLLHALLADSTMAFRQLPPARDPAWLRQNAVDVVGTIGSQKRGKAQLTGFEWDLDLVKHASFNKPAAWHPPPESRSPLVYFWYRSGPEHHSPSNRFAPTDPPLVTPGMECALFDLEGHLIEYHAVPTRKPGEPDPRPLDERRTDHEAKLFAAAGLKPENFRRTEPHYYPPVFADDLWGLEEMGGTGKWADVAVCGDRVVYFRVGEPFSVFKGRPDRAQGENVEAQGQRRLAGGFVTIAIVLLAVTAAGPVAYRNWQRGRADVSGAIRVLALYAICNTLSWLFITNHVPSLHVERVLLANSLGITAFWGAVLFVCYLAIEPYMRQRWPERLSSWSRLLSGKGRDPLVGRDILIGCIAGVCLSLPVKFAAAALGTYYLLSPVYDPLTPNVPAGLLFALVSFALIRTAGAFVLLLVLGWVFRRESVAAFFAVVAMTAGVVQSVATFRETSVVTWGVMLVVAGMTAFTMIRYGWIATFVALFVSGTINIMPLTLAAQAWYAPTTLITAAALLTLAVYGCVVSVGKQRFFPASP